MAILKFCSHVYKTNGPIPKRPAVVRVPFLMGLIAIKQFIPVIRDALTGAFPPVPVHLEPPAAEGNVAGG